MEVVFLLEQKTKTKGKRFYYAIMSVLLVACASTAAVAFFSSNVGDDTNYSQLPEVIGSPFPRELPALVPNDDVSDPASSTITKKKPIVDKKKVSYPKTMVAPVFGSVLLEFAQDKMVFSNTMQRWGVHTGVDIAANIGTAVKAVAAGTVEAVISDPRFGRTVIIDHGGNVRSLYSNLAETVQVTTGQNVKQGAVVGTVGDTAKIESLDKSHLHFEVQEKHMPVNPALKILFKN